MIWNNENLKNSIIWIGDDPEFVKILTKLLKDNNFIETKFINCELKNNPSVLFIYSKYYCSNNEFGAYSQEVKSKDDFKVKNNINNYKNFLTKENFREYFNKINNNYPIY